MEQLTCQESLYCQIRGLLNTPRHSELVSESPIYKEIAGDPESSSGRNDVFHKTLTINTSGLPPPAPSKGGYNLTIYHSYPPSEGAGGGFPDSPVISCCLILIMHIRKDVNAKTAFLEVPIILIWSSPLTVFS